MRLGVLGCLVDAPAAGDRLTTAGGDAGVGRHVAVDVDRDPHAGERQAHGFGRHHGHRGALARPDFSSTGDNAHRTVGVDDDHAG